MGTYGRQVLKNGVHFCKASDEPKHARILPSQKIMAYRYANIACRCHENVIIMSSCKDIMIILRKYILSNKRRLVLCLPKPHLSWRPTFPRRSTNYLLYPQRFGTSIHKTYLVQTLHEFLTKGINMSRMSWTILWRSRPKAKKERGRSERAYLFFCLSIVQKGLRPRMKKEERVRA